MEVLKVFFVVFAALLGSSKAQGLEWNPLFLGSNPGPTGLQKVLDEAIASVARISDHTMETADAARVRVQEVVESMKAAQDGARVALEHLTISKDLTDLATSIVTNVTNVISSCVIASNAEMTNLTIQTGLGIVSCFTDKIKEAEAILSDVLRLAANAVAVGPNALAGIKDCPAPTLLLYVQRLACIAAEVDKATRESLRIVFELTRNVAKANLLVATLPTDIQACVGLKIVSIVFRAGLVTANLGLCVIRGG